MKTISVIIPMFNSEKYLLDLFTHLNACDFTNNDEIIIVDNGSTDNSRKICEQFASCNRKIYKIVEYRDKSDSYASRNYGVKFAHGDILAFTDSDCRPTPEWLNAIRNSLNYGEVLAGDVQLVASNGGIWGLFDSVAHLSQCENNARLNCVATANMAVHRVDFDKVGAFEERFSGGDFDWSQRAYKKGMKIVFHSEALIYHPARETYEEIKKREQRVAYGRGVHHRLANRPYVMLIIMYLLRFGKLSTQLRYSKIMRERGAKLKDLFVFNMGFLAIRYWYVVFASRGYKGIEPRKYGIK